MKTRTKVLIVILVIFFVSVCGICAILTTMLATTGIPDLAGQLGLQSLDQGKATLQSLITPMDSPTPCIDCPPTQRPPTEIPPATEIPPTPLPTDVPTATPCGLARVFADPPFDWWKRDIGGTPTYDRPVVAVPREDCSGWIPIHSKWEGLILEEVRNFGKFVFQELHSGETDHGVLPEIWAQATQTAQPAPTTTPKNS